MTEPDPYDVLGIEPDATPKEIRAAFRGLVRRRHPDTSAEPTDGTDLRTVLDAYHRLIDPAERERHDRRRETGLAGGARRIVVRRGRPARSARRDLRACPGCRGAGRVRLARVCRTCGGSGALVALALRGPAVRNCPSCAGTGRVPTVGVCGTCGGSGHIRAR